MPSHLKTTVFHICAILWGALGHMEQETVTGEFSKDCILPCHFPPGDDEVINWRKESKNVHYYYHQRDQLEDQDPDYRNRTHLFHKNIRRGNASLKLSNLTLTDEGLYKCYVGTQQNKTEMEVMLQVRVSSYYALEYQKTDSERVLKCCAFLTYPAVNISWLQGSTSIQETEWEETRIGNLYSHRSHQNIANTTDPYYCRIHLPHEEWTAEWKMKDQLSSMEGSSTAISCEYSNNTTNTENLSVVWTLNRNAMISVLASFNGTPHSYQPRVQINQSDFSLILHDLTANDSGEYLCNISTPHNTNLTVRTLQVEIPGNTGNAVPGVIAAVVLVIVVAAIAAGACLRVRSKKCRRRGGMV